MKEETSASEAGISQGVIPFKAVIFDMDGTLLKSTEADFLAWEKIFDRYGKKLTYEQYLPMLGIRSKDVVKDYLGFTNDEDVQRILIEKYDAFVDVVNQKPVKPVEAAETFLKSLAAYPVKVALATSSRKDKTKLLLTKLNFFQYFDAVVTGDEVVNSKPAPDIFLKAAERLNVPPEDCLVVEDGPVGVEAAKNAGMICLAITATHPADKLPKADLTIDTYGDADLGEICRRLNRKK